MIWDLNLEQILKTFYEQATTSVWVHNRTASSFEDIEVFFAIPRIVLSGIVSSGALCLEYVKSNEIKSYALLGLALVGAINSLVGSIQLFFNLGQKSGLHRSSAMSFFELGSRIELTLKKHKSDRMNAKEFLDGVQSDFSRLQESSPTIPSYVISAFKRENKTWEGDVAYILNGLHPLKISAAVELVTADPEEKFDLSLARDGAPRANLHQTQTSPREGRDPLQI